MKRAAHYGALIVIMVLFSSCSKRPFFHYVTTTSVPGDADECEFWIHPCDPGSSLLIGNDKMVGGSLYCWGIDGKLVSKSAPINRSTGVAVGYGFPFGDKKIDIVVTADRSLNQLRVFQIDVHTRKLLEITTQSGIATEHHGEAYGVALYKRPKDEKFFAFISTKAKEDIHQIQLDDDGNGGIKGKVIRSFGKEDQESFIEGMCVDDELGFLYCSDEDSAILKYDANPAVDNNQLVLRFAKDDGIQGDREGLALYLEEGGKGYLILSSQGNSTFKIYQRAGNNAFVKTCYPPGVKDSDGIAATSARLPNYPKGMMACHNSPGRNFILYGWEEFFQANQTDSPQ